MNNEKRHADLILTGKVVTMDAQRRVIDDGAVVVAGSDIAALGERDAVLRGWQAPRQLGGDAIIIPGMIDAHTHCTQCFVRALTSNELPMIPRIYNPAQQSLSAEQAGAAVRLLAAQLIRSGVTTLCEGTLNPAHEDAIVAALQQAQLAFTRYQPIEPQIAALIAAGKVVARFDGRMEYGPRALGNRSILYHAKEPEVNQWLNQRLGRTEFMPFAPATMMEHRDECYLGTGGCEHAAQFMTLTFDCTQRMKDTSPAAVHVDGTARPQLVTKTSNPSFHRILEEYHALTGIPSLINTSFNMHEEPIVCSPEDAIRAFLQGNLDYLAIGAYLVAHPSAQQR